MRKEDISTENLVGKPQKPRDAVMISSEIELEAQFYPYTFSLLICCKDPGSTGEYCLEMYCDDKSAEVVLDKDFDLSQ